MAGCIALKKSKNTLFKLPTMIVNHLVQEMKSLRMTASASMPWKKNWKTSLITKRKD